MDKIFRDNKDKSKDEVKGIIREYLKIDPIIIPTSKYDFLGHADGYLAFLNESKVAYSSCTEEDCEKYDVGYSNEMDSVIEANKLSGLPIFDNPGCEKTRSGKDYLYNADGCYLNFLRVNDCIIYPQFTLKKKALLD